MHGEIKVSEFMDREARLQQWQRRQRQWAEWQALKQWWKAEHQVRRAPTPERRRAAEADRAKTAWLYRAELARAWPKWERVRAIRWGSGIPPVVADDEQ